MNNSKVLSESEAKDYIDYVLDVLFSLTEFTKDHGILTKKISYTPQGEFKKDATECRMSKGSARTVTLKFSDFPEYLSGVELNQAIAHGVCGYDTVNIVSKHKINGQADTIARSKDYFKFSDGPTLTMIDYDPDDGQPEREYTQVISIIDSVCPGFADIPKVLTYSTSSCIYLKTDNTEIRGKGSGFHLYFIAQNGQDLPRFAKALFERLWLTDHGYIKIARPGALLKRTIFDDSVFSPERLDFVAGANVMSAGIEQRRPDPLYIPGTISALDTTLLPSLSPEEQARYDLMVKAAKDAKAPEQAKIREKYIETEAPKLMEQHKELGKTLSLEDAKRTVRARCSSQNHDLYADDILLFDQLGAATVGDVLTDPGKYDEATLRDPLEPEQGQCKAQYLANIDKGAGKPVVHSFLHGGMNYFLYPDPAPGPATTIDDVLEWLESTDDRREILKEWVEKLRDLDAHEQDEIKDAIQKKTGHKISLLNAQLKEQVSVWATDDRKKAQAEISQARVAKGITEIVYYVNGTGIACHAASKALRNSKGGLIYRYGGNLSKIVDKPPSSVRMVKSMADQGAEYPPMPLISHLNQETVCHEIEKVAVLQRIVSEEDDVREDIPWPGNILKGVLALTEYHERDLIGIVEHPYVNDDFQPVTDPGYDPSTGLYKCFNGQIPNLFSTAEDALSYLSETVFSDFPFADDDLDRFAAVSCLLTGMQRRLIVDGSGCPGYLLNAPVQSSGKTTLAQVISYSLYGRPAAASTFSEDDTEMAKHLLGIMQEGHSCVLFDNIQEGASIESNELAKAITSDSYQNRWLGKNKTVTVPSSVLWMFTGNNVSVCGDFNTRILPIELDPRTANPDQRRFSRPDIGNWCEQNREKILSACMKVIMAGKDYKPNINPSRFPTWDRFVRYPIYKICGRDVAEIFQKNKLADPKLEGQRAFFEAWFETFGTAPVTAKDVLIKCQTQTAAGDSLSEALLDIFPGGLPNTRGLGKWLNGMRNRFHGDYRLRQADKVTSGPQKHSILWKVTETD